MNEIRIFNNPQFGDIRTTGTAQDPWFCLVDLSRMLDVKTDKRKTLDPSGIKQLNILTKGGIQPLNFINKKNMYRFIMRSRKPQAKPIQDWIFDIVLPSFHLHDVKVITKQETQETSEDTDIINQLVTKIKNGQEAEKSAALLLAKIENITEELVNIINEFKPKDHD